MYTLVLDGNEYSMQQITMNSHSNNSNVWTTNGWVNPSNLWLPPPPENIISLLTAIVDGGVISKNGSSLVSQVISNNVVNPDILYGWNNGQLTQIIKLPSVIQFSMTATINNQDSNELYVVQSSGNNVEYTINPSFSTFLASMNISFPGLQQFNECEVIHTWNIEIDADYIKYVTNSYTGQITIIFDNGLIYACDSDSARRYLHYGLSLSTLAYTAVNMIQSSTTTTIPFSIQFAQNSSTIYPNPLSLPFSITISGQILALDYGV